MHEDDKDIDVTVISLEDMSDDELDAYKEKLAEEAARKQQRIDVLGTSLSRKADEQIKHRRALEERWIEDLSQYNGIYAPDVITSIRNRKGSEVFVNITRHKTNTAEARLSDMLFPTDDKNWGIRPTPVPETTLVKLPNTKVYGKPSDPPLDIPSITKKREEVMEQAIKRAKLMEQDIDDQLTECKYSGEARSTIHDAVIYGTGIVKGPVVEGRYKKKWGEAEEGYKLQVEEELTPCARRVSIWDIFPDMSATRPDEAEFWFERHYFTRRELADLSQIPGFSEEAIRKVLSEESRSSRNTDTHVSRLREISGYTSEMSNENRYEVWEYTGPLDKETLDAADIEYDEDSLYDVSATVWFCENTVLKISVNPMETQEHPYSVFCFQEDDTSIFGVGVPFMMRNAQAAINSSWRMIMDNAGLSSGPQIIVNRALVDPADGDWTMTPRKVWHLKDKNRSVHEVFGSYNIESHQGELANIFQAAKQLADEETSVPMIAQGESGNVQQTASGMSMLMNNANIVLRRSIKIWDDNVTKPLITRFYDWNMQFSQKDEIKGDFKIDARGSSVLMAREVQMQNMIGLTQLSQSPAFAPMTDFKNLYKMVLRQMQMPVGEVMLGEEEIKKKQESQQQQQPELKDQAAMEKIKLEREKHQFDMQYKQQELQVKSQMGQAEFQKAQLQYEATMAKIANDRNISLEELQTQMGLKQMEINSEEKMMAFEAKVKTAFNSGL